MDLEGLFTQYSESQLSGRYVTLRHIEPLIDKHRCLFKTSSVGLSVTGKNIFSVEAGNGPTRVFMWSQMHGNESTTTKAIFDLLNFLSSNDELAVRLLGQFTFLILPMVNPDGAAAYTRTNANDIDLNRDSVILSQPESRVLRQCFDDFKPHWCFNMHDQRTIFAVGDTGKPATISFLSPSFNEDRDINECRLSAMNVIVAMNNTLQQLIPGQVGRFDDSFNINCIGDMFQSLGVPTILFEAGHYAGDYPREHSRKYVFIALLSGLTAIYENVIAVNESERYFDIPQNKVAFYDIIYRNVKINYENKEIITNFASQYKEVLFENSVIFEAFISDIGNLDNFQGHVEYDCDEMQYVHENGDFEPQVGDIANFEISNRIFKNGIEV